MRECAREGRSAMPCCAAAGLSAGHEKAVHSANQLLSLFCEHFAHNNLLNQVTLTLVVKGALRTSHLSCLATGRSLTSKHQTAFSIVQSRL